MKNKQFDVLVFDFDGVFVIDSDAVYKKEAWDIALSLIPKSSRDTLVAEGNARFGNGRPGGRREILRHALTESGLFTDVETELKEAAHLFDDYVKAKIAAEGVVVGAVPMLEMFMAQGYTLYLNSGTASRALRESAEILGIMPYITEALGSTQEPRGGSKVDNLRYIAHAASVSPEAVLMVGDSWVDYEAAREFGCSFVGVVNRWNQWDDAQPFPVIHGVARLGEWLEGRGA